MKTDSTNYNRIARAIEFYKGRGYLNVETPWIVTTQAVRSTLPLDKTMMETIRGVLVGSGEQGFIQSIMDGKLEPGMYQTTTPCFQDAGEHHSPYYFGSDDEHPWYQQITLFVYKPEPSKLPGAYEKVINDAMQCFFEVSDADAFDAIQSESGFDIRYNEIVLGSYGVRRMSDHLWIYGTGLVEPRFTMAMHSIAGVLEDQHSHAEASETPAIATSETTTVESITEEPAKPVPVLKKGNTASALYGE